MLYIANDKLCCRCERTNIGDCSSAPVDHTLYHTGTVWPGVLVNDVGEEFVNQEEIVVATGRTLWHVQKEIS